MNLKIGQNTKSKFRYVRENTTTKNIGNPPTTWKNHSSPGKSTEELILSVHDKFTRYILSRVDTEVDKRMTSKQGPTVMTDI